MKCVIGPCPRDVAFDCDLICREHDGQWEASGEAARGYAMFADPDGTRRWEVAFADWVRRVEAEARNGG